MNFQKLSLKTEIYYAPPEQNQQEESDICYDRNTDRNTFTHAEYLTEYSNVRSNGLFFLKISPKFQDV